MTVLVRVKEAVLDERELIMYDEQGNQYVIKQGDARVARLVPILTAKLSIGEIAEVDLSSEADRAYAKVEEKTNGFLKFFRIAKTTLAGIFSKQAEPVEEVPVVEGFDLRKKISAVEEIMANAVPASSASFENVPVDLKDSNNDRNFHTDDGDTIIAVVDGQTIVPDAHQIKHIIDHAANTEGGEVGLAKFYERFAPVAALRQHTAKDLMKFVQKGDLHFADDGSLLIYKALKTKGGYGQERDPNLFVDCHTGNVPQRVGTLVCMDESLVDKDRRNECSNGLHVARRQYIGGFSGDVITLCKVAPEDVIAVPEYDANKMRVCGYHILYRLNPEDFSAIKANKPLVSDEGKKMLAACIAGTHVGVLQTVKIGGHRGSNLTVIDHVEAEIATAKVEASNQKLRKLEPVEALNALDRSVPERGEVLDLQTVNEQAKQVKSLSRKDRAKELYEAWLKSGGRKDSPEWADLYSFKKASKVGWEKLGIPVVVETVEEMDTEVEDEAARKLDIHTANDKYLNSVRNSVEELEAMRELVRLYELDPDQVEVETDGEICESDIESFRASIQSAGTTSEPVKATASAVSGPTVKIRALINECGGVITMGIAKEIYQIKKASKKSWEKLGVNFEEQEAIEDQRK